MISVRIWRPILEKLEAKLEAACLRRDAYLRRVLELEIEKTLTAMFPGDSILPVAKGQKGGDVLHEIFHRSGQSALAAGRKRRHSCADSPATRWRCQRRS